MNRLISLLLLTMLSVQAMAQSVVRNLDIAVTLRHDGSAHIHEVWNIDIGDDVKSEWYVAHYNMGERQITNLAVTDNGARMLTVDGEWDVDADREDKIGKCGIRPYNDGYEICWGVSSHTPHVYTADYDITGLVQSFPDKDGFGYWFADLNDNDPIRSFRLSVSAPLPLSASNCQVLGFGYKGDAKVGNGIVVARSDGEVDKIGLLMSFEKGLFAPSVSGKGSFSEFKAKAMEGSDFGGGSKEGPVPVIVWILLGCFVGCVAVFLMVWWLRVVFKRRRVRQLPYFKEVSPSWTLLGAAAELKKYYWFDDDNLIAAMIFKLISRRKLEIVNGHGFDDNGRRKKVLKVVDKTERPERDDHSDDYICDFLLHIMSSAAGDDGVLKPESLEKWAESHEESMEDFNEAISTDKDSVALSDEDALKLLGLRNYLMDFGRVGDKHVRDVRVWDDLLVYTQLFGIAKKLSEDIQTICPEYFEMSSFGKEVNYMYINYPRYFLLWSNSVNTSVSSASSGGSSLTGGGGFSGGGGGGDR